MVRVYIFYVDLREFITRVTERFASMCTLGLEMSESKQELAAREVYIVIMMIHTYVYTHA